MIVRSISISIRKIMDNEEIEFIAENQLITVIPNFQYKTLYLIGVCDLIHL